MFTSTNYISITKLYQLLHYSLQMLSDIEQVQSLYRASPNVLEFWYQLLVLCTCPQTLVELSYQLLVHCTCLQTLVESDFIVLAREVHIGGSLYSGQSNVMTFSLSPILNWRYNSKQGDRDFVNSKQGDRDFVSTIKLGYRENVSVNIPVP